jgi:hypothetical protein
MSIMMIIYRLSVKSFSSINHQYSHEWPCSHSGSIKYKRFRCLENRTLETAATADISARAAPELSVSTYELAYECTVVRCCTYKRREEEAFVEVVSAHLLLSVIFTI